jgi:hypothetical protein
MAQHDTGTKVLLPEEPAAPASPKRRLGVIGILGAGSLVVILLLGMVLMLVGHKSSPAAPGTQANTGTTSSGTNSSGGSSGSKGSTGAVAPSTQDGIPVSYAHSQGGAVSAAVNFEMARSTAGYFTDTAARDQVLSVIMAPQSLASEVAADGQATASVLSNLGLSQGQTSSLLVRSAPMGTKIDSYASSLATVEVWMAGVVGVTDNSSSLTPTASWDTYTYTLTWINGDWKAVSISAANGPTPLSNNQTPTPVHEWANITGSYSEPPYTG